MRLAPAPCTAPRADGLLALRSVCRGASAGGLSRTARERAACTDDRCPRQPRTLDLKLLLCQNGFGSIVGALSEQQGPRLSVLKHEQTRSTSRQVPDNSSGRQRLFVWTARWRKAVTREIRSPGILGDGRRVAAGAPRGLRVHRPRNRQHGVPGPDCHPSRGRRGSSSL